MIMDDDGSGHGFPSGGEEDSSLQQLSGQQQQQHWSDAMTHHHLPAYIMDDVDGLADGIDDVVGRRNGHSSSSSAIGQNQILVSLNAHDNNNSSGGEAINAGSVSYFMYER